MIPHYRIHCTALAAALGTLGVELDPTEPFDRLVDTDSGREQIVFLFRDRSVTDDTRRTEEMVTAWTNRPRFEKDFPTHPLVSMRAAHDARGWLLKVIHGAALPPVRDFRGDKFATPHLAEACILKAHGFPLLLLTGREFSFPDRCQGVMARQIIERSQKAEGASAAQWQARFLVNLNLFLDRAKCVPTVITRDENRACLFSADLSKTKQDEWLDRL